MGHSMNRYNDVYLQLLCTLPIFCLHVYEQSIITSMILTKNPRAESTQHLLFLL